MTSINLDFMKFPTGEVHYKETAQYKKLNASINNNLLYIPYDRNITINDWIMQIMLAAKPGRDLFIPYLPYSRQDRPTSPLEPFSLKTFGRILNTAGFRKVYTMDVHSDVSHGCIDNLVNIPIEFIYNQSDLPTSPALVVPDQGAYKRLSKLMTRFGKSPIVCIKERNTKTGHLEIKHVIGDVPPWCVIIDDICDGGMTFILLAEELRKRGAERIDLFVTHGVFSKGLEVLKGIDNVYTTDSFPQPYPHDKLKFSYCTNLLAQYRGHYER